MATQDEILIKVKTDTNKALKELGIVNKKLATLEKTSKTSGKSLNSFSSQSKALGKQLAGLAVAVGGVQSALGAVSTLANFEKSMKTLQAVSKATDDQLQQLEETAKKMGETTQFSATQSADALVFLAKAGFSVQDSITSLPSVLTLATVGNLDLALASDIASDSLTAMGLEAEDMSKLVDIFATTSTSANVSVEQLGESFKKVAPLSSTLGISVEETAGAIGVLGDAGLKAENAGTALKIILLRLSTSPAPVKKAFDELGVSAFNVDGSMKSLTTILTDIKPKLAELSEEARAVKLKEIAGSEAIAGFSTLINNTETLTKRTKDLENSSGSAGAMAKVMGDTLSNAWKSVGSAIEGVILKGDALTPLLTQMANDTADWIREIDPNKITAFASGIGSLVSTIAELISTLTSMAIATASFIEDNKTLLTVIGSVAVGLKVMTIANEQLASKVLLTAVATNGLREKFLGFIKIATTFAKANPILIAMTAIAGAVALVTDHFSKASQIEQEYYNKQTQLSGEYLKVIQEVAQHKDRETGALALTTAEREKAFVSLGNYINKVQELLNTGQQANESDEQWAKRLELLNSQMEHLIIFSGQLTEAKITDTQATKELTSAEKSLLIEQKKATEEQKKSQDNLEKFKELYEKRVEASEKAIESLVSDEQKLAIAHKQLIKERIGIESAFINSRLAINKSYEENIYNIEQRGLTDFQKFQQDKEKAETLAIKAREALSLGQIEKASQYYSESKELANSFANNEIEQNGKVLVSREESLTLAKDIFRQTKEGELEILALQETKEKEANTRRIEASQLEVTANQLSLKVQEEKLQAIVKFGEKLESEKAKLSNQDYFDKLMVEFQNFSTTLKEEELQIKTALNREKLNAQLSQVESDITTTQADMTVGAVTSVAESEVNALVASINSRQAFINVKTIYNQSEGGAIPQKLATGGTFIGSGKVAGYDSTDSDKVNAKLTGGEVVIKRTSVDSIGAGRLLEANRTGKLPAFSKGGFVGNFASGGVVSDIGAGISVGASSEGIIIPIDVDTTNATANIKRFTDESIQSLESITTFAKQSFNDLNPTAGSSLFGLNKIGGTFGGFAEGGKVAGHDLNGSDNVPAMLTMGEYVLPTNIVDKIGVANLDRIRAGNFSSLGFAEGGFVGNNTSNTNSNTKNEFTIKIDAGASDSQVALQIERVLRNSL